MIVNTDQQLSLPILHRKLMFTKKVIYKSEEASLVIIICFTIFMLFISDYMFLYITRLKNLMKLDILYHIRRKIPFLQVMIKLCIN